MSSDFLVKITLLSLLLLNVVSVNAQPLSPYEEFIERLADLQLNIADSDQQEVVLVALLQEAEAYRDANPDLAEAWIGAARVRGVYALRKRSLAMAKQIKAAYEKALTLDPTAQRGIAQGYLGQVYLQVPGWPIGFGDEEKGLQLLRDTVTSYPDNALINLFYAQYLVSEKQYQTAREYVVRANEIITADAVHPKARQLQQRTADDLLQTIDEKL